MDLQECKRVTKTSYISEHQQYYIPRTKYFDFSTLYITTHEKLKSRLASVIWNSFIFKNGNHRYTHLVPRRSIFSGGTLWLQKPVLWRQHFRGFCEKDFRADIIGIPIGTNCAPLLADIFLYSREEECIQALLSGRKQLVSWFNCTYIDYILSINNPTFEN